MTPSPPKLSDLLTPKQIEALALNIDLALQTHGRFEIVLIFDKMELRYLETRKSSSVPEGKPPLMTMKAQNNGKLKES